MEPREWFDYAADDLKDEAKRKEVFKRMLQVLEKRGDCRYVYHRLSISLFNEDIGE